MLDMDEKQNGAERTDKPTNQPLRFIDSRVKIIRKTDSYCGVQIYLSLFDLATRLIPSAGSRKWGKKEEEISALTLWEKKEEVPTRKKKCPTENEEGREINWKFREKKQQP